jgi:hypothetical protein
MDLAAWFLVSSFTVDQAALLWSGLDPARSDFSLTNEERTRVAPRKQMLVAAIMAKELPAETKHNALSFIGNHDKSLVSRSDLEKFARMKRDFPAFLFDTLLTSGAEGQGAESTPPAPKNKGGRPPEHDWDAVTIEVIRVANKPDGLPDSQAELIDHLLEWSGRTLGREPPLSSVKARVSKIYKGLGIGRKPNDA